MTEPRRTGIDRIGRLRLLLGALFVALAAPAAVLVLHARTQIAAESYQHHRRLAVAFAERVDAELQRAIAIEEARSQADYGYFIANADPLAKDAYVQRSVLAQLPVASALPGAIGHFQIDGGGAFSTPLLPGAEGHANAARPLADAVERQATYDRLLELLTRNRLARPVQADKGDADASQAAASAADAEQAEGDAQAQQAFDALDAPAAQQQRSKSNTLGRVAELKLQQSYPDEPAAKRELAASAASTRAPRKEQNIELAAQRSDAAARVQLFESEVDPFRFGLLESGHAVLFRNVWRDGQRTVQGLLLEQTPFLDAAIVAPFRQSPLGAQGDLVIAYRGDVVSAHRADGVQADAIAGELLHRTRLAAPFDGIELLLSMRELPPGPGYRIVVGSGAVLVAVLLLAFAALYRLGVREIALVQQQRNFVAAVSHELKTPLTSIRMYAEMLREGWAAEPRKQEYYAYILDESERLSRLIANVLQLAKLERGDSGLACRPLRVATALDMVRSKLQTRIERSGFTVEWRLDPAIAEREIDVDADALLQILINLVDNALKFAAAAARREIAIAAEADGAAIVLSVRDYGPGIPADQLSRVFELFYRGGDELTRATPGTGIGLALVRQLARAMGGDVVVCNREPGAEIRLVIPVHAGVR